MRAELVTNNFSERTYRISTGELIKIIAGEEKVNLYNSKNEEIGEINFRVIELEHGEIHKVTWMYLDKLGDIYKKMGLGRAAIETYKEYFDATITAAENNGQQEDDGSHLTQDAPGFIAKLRREGVVE